MNTLVEFLNGLDSFKKILLFLLSGLTALTLFLGYRVVQSDKILSLWDDPPTIISVNYPCYLQQIREKRFVTAINFPIPEDVRDHVVLNVTAYVTNDFPDPDLEKLLCKSLQKMILDPEAERWLIPLQPSPSPSPSTSP